MRSLLAILVILLASCVGCTHPLPDQNWDFHLGLEVSFTTEPNHTPSPPVPPDKRPEND